MKDLYNTFYKQLNDKKGKIIVFFCCYAAHWPSLKYKIVVSAHAKHGLSNAFLQELSLQPSVDAPQTGPTDMASAQLSAVGRFEGSQGTPLSPGQRPGVYERMDESRHTWHGLWKVCLHELSWQLSSKTPQTGDIMAQLPGVMSGSQNMLAF